MTVLGPDRGGVVVVTTDHQAALEDRMWLEGHSIPSVIPLERGLVGWVRHGAATHEDPLEEARARVEGWARALRRVAVAREGDRALVAAPAGPVRETPEREVGPIHEALAVRPPSRVAVFGGAWITEDDPEYPGILDLGKALAEEGIDLVCGGYQGAMAAASRGASETGGVAVGVTVDAWAGVVDVNRWLTHEIVARDLFSRLPILTDADAWVAFSGGVGTLHEVSLCWNLVQTRLAEPRPLVLVGERWDRKLQLFRELLLVSDPAHFDLVVPARSPDEVLAAILE